MGSLVRRKVGIVGLEARLQLPPGFTLVELREVGDAHAAAIRLAPTAGAGTLVRVGRLDTAEFAVILEPTEPLATARRALYAVEVAVMDALAAVAPPEKPIAVEWPTVFRVDGAMIGRCRLAWPDEASEAAMPDWLVASVGLQLYRDRGPEPGNDPNKSTLAEEGFAAIDGMALVASFAHHLLKSVHDWQELGFASVAERFLPRLWLSSAQSCRLATTGDLLVMGADGEPAQRRSLQAALQGDTSPAAN